MAIANGITTDIVFIDSNKNEDPTRVFKDGLIPEAYKLMKYAVRDKTTNAMYYRIIITDPSAG